MTLVADLFFIIAGVIFIFYKAFFPHGISGYISSKKVAKVTASWVYPPSIPLSLLELSHTTDYELVKYYRYSSSHQEEMWERIERFKQTYPEYCAAANEQEKPYNWSMVGKYRSPMDTGEQFSCVLDLLVQTYGHIRPFDALGIKDQSARGRYIRQHGIPSISPPLSEWTKAQEERKAALRREQESWPEQYPKGKFVGVDPHKFSFELLYRFDVDMYFLCASEATKNRFYEYAKEHCPEYLPRPRPGDYITVAKPSSPQSPKAIAQEKEIDKINQKLTKLAKPTPYIPSSLLGLYDAQCRWYSNLCTAQRLYWELNPTLFQSFVDEGNLLIRYMERAIEIGKELGY